MTLEVDKCCGCVSLRTGSLIFGYLTLTFHFFIFLICCIAIGLGISIAIGSTDDDVQDAISLIILGVSSILLIVKVFCMLFTVLLIVGVHRNKRALVQSYLVYLVIGFIISFILTVVYLGSDEVDPYMLTLIFCEIGFSLYFFIVIRSHYRRMQVDDLKLPALYNTD